MSNFNLIYTTTKNIKEAEKIAVAAVKNKLAACANIIPGLKTVYKWEGEIKKDKETALILKTRKDKIKKLTALIKTSHSYNCPCVLVLPVVGGSKGFLKWIEENLK